VSRPALIPALQTGAIRVWGRVETGSLAEFYSRSTVLVVPSSREQYGLVAVEAMMCGCPVVGSSVGGLQDLIVPGANGRRVPVDDASLLANVLSAYLRDPAMGKRQGVTAARWARQTLRQKDVYGRYEEVYFRAPHPGDPLSEGWMQIRRRDLEALGNAVQRLVGGEVQEVNDVSAGLHLCAKVVFADGQSCFAKRAAQPDWPEGAAIPLPARPAPPWSPAELVCAYAALPEFAPMPRLLAADPDSGVVITPWYDPCHCATRDEALEAIQAITRELRACPAPEWGEWVAALEAVETDRSRESVRRFDEVAAVHTASSRAARFRPVHPQVELLRLGGMLRRPCWSLPDAFATRAGAVAGFLLDRHPFVIQPPALCHGDLSVRRLLRGATGPLAADPETSRHAWGPLDEARAVFHVVRQHETLSAASALRHLDALVEGEADRHLAVCWLVVHLLYHAIQELTRGDTAGVRRTMHFFHGFFEALYGRRVTR
jgi:hypothetical protein